MRKAAQLLVVFLLSAIVTVGLAGLMGIRVGGDGERSRSPGVPSTGTGTEAGPATTQPLTAAGHLREAQDEYLRILRDHPADAGAMRGLVAVRRRLAGDDPVVLRRQATAYQQLVASGVEPPEHYSRKAMELLASASLQAAAAVESERRNTAQRANRASRAATSQGASPPASRATPDPRNKVNLPGTVAAHPAPSKTSPVAAPPAPQSQVPPGQAGAPPTPAQPTVQAPTAPTAQPPTASTADPPTAPQTPPAASTTPQQPAAGQTAPAPPASEGTVAVVPPPTAGPALAPSEGSLAKIDCQKRTFVLHGSNGDEEYLTAPNFTIYIRGISSERLSDFCGLQRHLGRAAMVWSIPDGDRKIAKSISVVLPAQ